jgi:hypothetical protein
MKKIGQKGVPQVPRGCKREDVPDEIGTNKSRATGNKGFHRLISFGAANCGS